MLSIVVPVYNSSSFLHLLLEAIETERVKNFWELEVILVDDGSKDQSFEKIIELSSLYSYVKGVKLSRNFGHQLAVRTGFKFCSGDFIAVIDDDLQDPPSLLGSFIKYLEEGYDVVYGVRKKRKEGIFKKISYHLFYRLLDLMSHTKIPLDSGDFCVMKKQVLENMLLFPEKNPYLRGIRAWVGFKQIGVEYDRNSRVAGDSGYSLSKLFQIAFNGIFSFSNLPLKLITLSGTLGLISATIYVIYIIYKFFFFGIEVKGFVSLAILISFFSSLILICLGIVGEYIARIYDEVRDRPHSVVYQTVNI
jgi:glycosyltransferase involved in cell wall biosynthesis